MLKLSMMKTILPFLLLFFAFSLSGQDTPLEELEEQFEESDGIASIELGNALFDILYNLRAYEEAVEVAQEIGDRAEDLDDANLEAIALNLEAKALIGMKEKRFKHRTRAISRIRKSQKLIKKNDIDNEELVESNNALLLVITENLGVEDNLNTALQFISKSIDSVKFNVDDIELPEELLDLDFKKPSQKVVQEAVQKEEKKRAEAELKRNQEQEKMVNRILEANKKQLESEMARLSKTYIPSMLDNDSIIQNSMKGMKEVQVVWKVAKEEIKKELAKEATKIKEMDSEEVKDELLLAHYKNRYDSLAHLRLMDSLNLVKQDAELQQQESELARQKTQQSLTTMGAGGSSILFLLILFSYFKQRKSNRLLSDKNLQIQAEQNRSEGLLLNILPAKVADELKEFGTAQAHKYEGVSVLFTDFKNFSQIAEQLSAEQLVAELDYCFKAFDNIIDKYGLEKIKTIGDAYMCAGGLPMPNADNPKLAVQAAIEIQAFLDKWNQQKIKEQQLCFEARVGIHTGPVVAGVVGTKKFAYDIWGDTVNIAARMESKGEAGKINISGTTHELIKDDFDCAYRGMIKVKNKGEIAMYFVEG